MVEKKIKLDKIKSNSLSNKNTKFDKLESLNFGRVLSIKDGIVVANV